MSLSWSWKLQVRKDFICFCIGFCFADADTNEVMQTDKEVTALMKIRVSRMLEIFKQPPLVDEEMENFKIVLCWIVTLQKEVKKGFNTKQN